MPMLTTSVKRAPLTRDPSLVHAGDELADLREFRAHLGHHVLPVREHRALGRLRSAMCIAARRSV